MANEDYGKPTIIVTVQDSSGDALVGATGTVTPQPGSGSSSVSGTTPDNGKVTLAVTSGITYTAGGSMTGFQNKSNVPVANGNATVSLTMDSGNGIIKATVTTSAVGHAPIAGATVTATPTGGSGIARTTNTSGVAINSVAAAAERGTTYSVVASKSGFVTSLAQSTTVTQGTTNDLSFTLTPNP